jgi:hypothetical protein
MNHSYESLVIIILQLLLLQLINLIEGVHVETTTNLIENPTLSQTLEVVDSWIKASNHFSSLSTDLDALKITAAAGSTDAMLCQTIPQTMVSGYDSLEIRVVGKFDDFTDGSIDLYDGQSCDDTGGGVKFTTLEKNPDYIEKFTGDCRNGIELRMYEGDGDNDGTEMERVHRCKNACLNKKPPLNGAVDLWTNYNLEGFIVVKNTGRCYCENVKSVEPDCDNIVGSPYTRYDLLNKLPNNIITLSTQFQVNPVYNSVSVIIRITPEQSIWIQSISVYRVLCNPNVNFHSALPPFKFGFTGKSARLNENIYFSPGTEQVFSENPYEGDESSIVPVIYGAPGDTNFYTTDGAVTGSYKCNSLLSPRVYCWNHGGQNNKNVKSFNLLKKSWSTLGKLPEKRYSGHIVSCGGKIWSLGGYSASEYWDLKSVNEVNDILKAVWVFTPEILTISTTKSTEFTILSDAVKEPKMDVRRGSFPGSWEKLQEGVNQ